MDKNKNKALSGGAEMYYRECMDLSKTLKVLSTSAARSVNKRSAELGARVSDDKKTWKYFLNASGQYHELDKPMYIMSADTGESILLSLDTLQSHPSTREMSKYGTKEYYSLVHRFPEQESLILGILYPCDIDIAVSSEDGQILAHPSYLVEPQETSLIRDVGMWLEAFISRWHINGYEITNSYYSASRHAAMYSRLPSVIMSLRLKKIKTIEAHSFHIKEYFKSNYGIHVYYDYLTRRQVFWLYMNIRYIVRSAGQQETLYLLIENILSRIGIPVSQYHIRQIAGDKDGVAKPMSRRSVAKWSSRNGELVDIKKIMPKEQAGDLFSSHKEPYKKVLNRIKRHRSGKTSTKFLEALYVDNTESILSDRTDLAVSQWMFYASIGATSGSVVINSPTKDSFAVPHKEALFMLFGSESSSLSLVTSKSGFTPLTGFWPGSVWVLKKIKESGIVLLSETISRITNMPDVEIYTSVSAFKLWIDRASESISCTMRYLSNSTESSRNKFILTSIMSPVINIKAHKKESDSSAEDILSGATGLNRKDLLPKRKIQRELVGMVKHLSSYTIKFIDDIDTQSIYLSSVSADAYMCSAIEGGAAIFGWLDSTIKSEVKDLSVTTLIERSLLINETTGSHDSMLYLVPEISSARNTDSFNVAIQSESTDINIEREDDYTGPKDFFIPDVFKYENRTPKAAIEAFIRPRVRPQ